MELLEQWDSYSIHSGYYIKKHVNAALQRCLGLAPYHADVNAWFEQCPKPRRRIHFWPSIRSRQNTMMISNFFGSDRCSLCGGKCSASSRAKAAVCRNCRNNETKAVEMAMRRLNIAQTESLSLARKCSDCNQCFEDSSTFAMVRSVESKGPRGAKPNMRVLVTPLGNCSCIDCPVTFERHRSVEKQAEAKALCDALDLL